jgi:hypothetical protein
MDSCLPDASPLEDRPTTLRPSPARHRMAGLWLATAQLDRCFGLAQSDDLRHGV